MKNTDYKITFDKENNRATFEDVSKKEVLYKTEARFEDVAEMYRFMACYFLEMAYHTEHTHTYDTPPVYTSREEWRQIMKMFKGGYHNGIIQPEEE